MAAYIPVPRDLTRVKSKILFNLTKRQLLCFGAGALIGVPSFFLLKAGGNTSMAPIPFSTFGNREQSMVGQNYLRSLFALGFQGFLIMICVGIYAVLIQSVSVSDDIIGSIWGILGYTVLLCFTLFKTGALAKSVFSAH